MMKEKFHILIAPDSFKGSLSATKICRILHNKLSDSGLSLQFRSIPLADGGEGSLEAIMQICKFLPVKLRVLNPQLKEIDAFYLFDQQNNTAYIELAQASGLGLVQGNNDIMHASTYGTGQLIKHTINAGASKIVIFLGGSATCDAGLGIAESLRIQFYNSDKERLSSSAGKMHEISGFDATSPVLQGKNIEMLLAVDVNNQFYGSNGASFVYSPQKGADPQQVKLLDDGLKNIARIIKIQKGIDLQQIPGSGAAGGAAGGLYAFFNAKIIKGTDFIFNLMGLEEQIKKADLIISGEGKIDNQSLNNKLLYAISRITAKYDKKLWAICGYFEGTEQLKHDLFIDKVFSLAKSKEEITDSIANAAKKIEEKSEEIISALKEITDK